MLFKKKYKQPMPHKGFVIIKGKKVKISLSKATTSYSSKNNTFVGQEVGAGNFKKRFSSNTLANAYSQKLIKINKGLSGSGEYRGVNSKPLYYGTLR